MTSHSGLGMTTLIGDKIALFFGSVFFCGFLDSERLKDVPGAEDFGDGPGLGDASTRGMWRLAVKDFSERADSVLVELMGHGFQIREGRTGIAVHAVMCQYEGANEPSPHRALMIGPVSLPHISAIVSDILRIFRSQAA